MLKVIFIRIVINNSYKYSVAKSYMLYSYYILFYFLFSFINTFWLTVVATYSIILEIV